MRKFIHWAVGGWLGLWLIAACASETPTPRVIPHNLTAVPFPTFPPAWTPVSTAPPPSPVIRSSSMPQPTHTPTITPTPTDTPRPPLPITPTIIGYSVAQRPLEVYAFGHGATKRLIVTGIHGGYEANTIALADELLSYLITHPEVIPPDKTLYILRALNPDGAARSTSYTGRANEHFVDLNHNFPSRWIRTTPLPNCWDYLPLTSGDSAGSEPETQALMRFITTSGLDAIISYHSAALGIFAGGMPPDDKSVSLAQAAAAVSDYPYPPINIGCDYRGQLIDWASEQGIAALDIELTNHSETDFAPNLRILEVFLAWSP